MRNAKSLIEHNMDVRNSIVEKTYGYGNLWATYTEAEWSRTMFFKNLKLIQEYRKTYWEYQHNNWTASPRDPEKNRISDGHGSLEWLRRNTAIELEEMAAYRKSYISARARIAEISKRLEATRDK